MCVCVCVCVYTPKAQCRRLESEHLRYYEQVVLE